MWNPWGFLASFLWDGQLPPPLQHRPNPRWKSGDSTEFEISRTARQQCHQNRDGRNFVFHAVILYSVALVTCRPSARSNGDNKLRKAEQKTTSNCFWSEYNQALCSLPGAMLWRILNSLEALPLVSVNLTSIGHRLLHSTVECTMTVFTHIDRKIASIE